MKVVQTELNDVEYKLLEEYAKKRGRTIKEVLRDATLSTVMSDTVQPDDPIFMEPSRAEGTGKRERTSAEHNKFLYGDIG